MSENENDSCAFCGKTKPETGREECDKCFIQLGKNSGNWIPFNSNSWDDFDDFKKWQWEYDRRKVLCEKCGKLMLRTTIYRHMETIHHVIGYSVVFA